MATDAPVRTHSELYLYMTSLAHKVEVSQDRVDRIRRVVGVEQLTSAAMMPPKRGSKLHLRRLDYWRQQVSEHGWPDGMGSEE